MKRKHIPANKWYRPIWKEYLWMICMAYAFSGINLIVCAFFVQSKKPLFVSFLILGIIFLGMVWISIIDNRKGLRGPGYTIACLVFMVLIATYLACSISLWMFAVLASEILLGILILLIHKYCLTHKKQKS